MSDLLDALLSKPVAPVVPATLLVPDRDFTRKLELGDGKNTLTAEIRDADGKVNEGTALKYLTEEGLTPSEWESTGFRKIKYGAGMESVRFTYKRVASSKALHELKHDELAELKAHKPTMRREQGDHTFILALGDMQFGKIDGDGVEGTLKRTIECIDKAADQLAWYRTRFDIGHVHIAWLGDHIEGFESQGGANVFRTPMPLSDQIRLTRRTMLHSMLTFADLAERVSLVAVPGNHGETARFAGKGTTRYDDSHDTESLIAVNDGARLTSKFDHVEFYVPETDELTVALDLSGTTTVHAHGHKWRPGKHFEYWQGQAFNRHSAFHAAKLMLAGHLHHEHTDSDGDRLFMQPPAMESESTWWRHARGTTGAPGGLVAVTKDGHVPVKELIR